MSSILVTGGSGFIGSHCILQLLAAGHQVRTTVRSRQREADVRAMLKEGGAEPGDRLSFAVADLEADAGWHATHAKARRVLGWTPRSNEEALVATAESLVRLGLLRDSARQAA